MWISIDETQDCQGRYITNITVGSHSKNEQSTPHLLMVEQSQTTNSSVVSDYFIDSMNLLWPNMS